MVFKPRVLAASLAAIMPCGFVVAAEEANPSRLEEVVVTAPMMLEPLVVTTDPKAPRQPVPAHDGADYLKTIPGFSVIRKAGADGDPVLRGMAGSRLNILMDGEAILGGCGNRMDPPTAYVFPEAYDKITVLKGPQTVLHGGGNSAGTVLFERSVKRFDAPGVRADGSLMFGSFGRNDQRIGATAGNPTGYVQFNGTRSDSDDYEDGSGKKIHSSYTRWSTGAVAGWTPDKDTRVELSLDRSDGEAAYADRTMDGIKFDRTGYGVKFEKSAISTLVDKVEAQVFHNYVDHVMDNYTLRSQSGTKMVSNPDRLTEGGRFAATLRLSERTQTTLGADFQNNKHTLRKASAAGVDTYTSLARLEDMNFKAYGVFGEVSHDLSAKDRLIGGVRVDWSQADDLRSSALTGAGAAKTTYGLTDKDTLTSGFGRYEHALTSATTLFAGLGHVERAPDYWERTRNPNAVSSMNFGTASTFLINPEKTTQLDVGAVWNAGKLRASVSGYYAKIHDYILIQQINAYASDARNINATTYGGEADVSYALNDAWKVNATLAYVHGDNDTDGTPLAQLPPLEGRLGLNYDDKVYSAGMLLRLVSEQDRFQAGYGNIVGQDIGKTAGFSVFSLNAGYRPKKGTLISGGIDNLFDKNYAEHISRTGSPMNGIAGFTPDTRVNEPGRNLWVKLNIALD